jgi:alkylation response protein AidB-like acyl-CoA dehydrogenase
MCQAVAQVAVQVHGGAGFTEEFKVEQYFRDSMIMTIGGGTSEMQLDIIGRKLGMKYERYGPGPASVARDA